MNPSKSSRYLTEKEADALRRAAAGATLRTPARGMPEQVREAIESKGAQRAVVLLFSEGKAHAGRV